MFKHKYYKIKGQKCNKNDNHNHKSTEDTLMAMWKKWHDFGLKNQVVLHCA